MEQNQAAAGERNILLRGLYMLLMALAWQVCGTILLVVAIIQFAVALLTGTPNARLATFGRSLARYTRQVVDFLTFATEDIPFPFNDWPAGE